MPAWVVVTYIDHVELGVEIVPNISYGALFVTILHTESILSLFNATEHALLSLEVSICILVHIYYLSTLALNLRGHPAY